MASAPGTGSDARRRAEQIAAAFPALLVAADRVASTVAQGVHGRWRVGPGETFWQYRQFEFGDSPRLIDWRRSARSDRLFVRQTEWEAAQSVWLWPDASASMRYSSARGTPEKRERAVVLCLALASLLVRAGERIALLGDAAPPGGGRAALERIAVALMRGMAREPEPGALPRTDDLPRHATAVLVSDFLADADGVLEFLRDLAGRGVRGHLLQVLDPSEATLPFRGRTRFRGLEGEGELLVGRAESLRGGYLDRLAALQSALRTFARRAEWTCAVHRTDAPPEPPLLGLFAAMTEARHAQA